MAEEKEVKVVLTEDEKQKVNGWIEDMRGMEWRKEFCVATAAAPARLEEPNFTVDDPCIDIINNYHAFCMPCQEHIYNRSVQEVSGYYGDEVQSYFKQHINSEEHKQKCFQYKYMPCVISSKNRFVHEAPKDTQYGKVTGYCKPCDSYVEGQYEFGENQFKPPVTVHLETEQHNEKAILWKKPVLSLMVAIAWTPPFRAMYDNKFCQICDNAVRSLHHIASYWHAAELKNIFTEQLGLTVNQLMDTNVQREILNVMVKAQPGQEFITLQQMIKAWQAKGADSVKGQLQSPD